MPRRNFLKSSVFLSGLFMASAPRWAVGDQVRFGFYYPTYITPDSIGDFVKLFQRAGINASVESLIDYDVHQIIERLQSGYFAGTFISSNLVAEKVRALQVFSDGPDRPSYQATQSWAVKNQPLWDAALGEHNLQRVPFVNIGARRGVWVNPDWISKKNGQLRGAKVFATGVWAELLAKQGAEIVFRYDNPTQVDILFLSNIFAATKTDVHKYAHFYRFDEGNYDDSSATGFDLFLNKDYWQSLTPRAQEDVQKYTTQIGGARVSAMFKDLDSRMLPVYDQKQLRLEQLPELASALRPELAREFGLQALIRNASSATEKRLLESFAQEFPLNPTRSLT